MKKSDIKAPVGQKLVWFTTGIYGLPVRSGVYPIQNKAGEVWYSHFNKKVGSWSLGFYTPKEANDRRDVKAANGGAFARVQWGGLIK
jgi:hypothetical protein